MVGGSSSINGMVYVRGHALDFDTWEEMGAAGWGHRHVLPYYKRMETSHGGQDGWRGAGGPLHVTRGVRKNPLYRAFVEAGREAGYEVTQDYNGEQQEGFGAMEMTVWGGRRWSAANAYLRPALKRPNVSKLSGALVRRVLFEGARAVGVEYEQGGGIFQVHANREVVLAAGSINSPKLLQISGVGNAAMLKDLGIEPVADRPGVGENLQDHLEIYLQMTCTQPVSLYKHLGLISKGMIGLEWLLFKNRARRDQPFRVLRLHPLGPPASNIPTSSITSCPSRSDMTARPRCPITASRPMSGRCAPGAAAGSGSPRATRARRRRSSSTTCPSRRTGRTSGPASG